MEVIIEQKRTGKQKRKYQTTYFDQRYQKGKASTLNRFTIEMITDSDWLGDGGINSHIMYYCRIDSKSSIWHWFGWHK